MKGINVLRISKKEEMMGLDVAECGGHAYQIPINLDQLSSDGQINIDGKIKSQIELVSGENDQPNVEMENKDH